MIFKLPIMIDLVFICFVYVVRIIDMSSTQNIVDVCLQETGGLGVNCIIDSGGKCIVYMTILTSISIMRDMEIRLN